MYKLSKFAADDFAAIFEYTLLNFGLTQAEQYTQKLDGTLRLLAESPLLGRDASDLLADTRRYDHASHSIFYQIRTDDIFILRILHQQMDLLRQQFKS